MSDRPMAISQWTKAPVHRAEKPVQPPQPTGVPKGFREIAATVYTDGKTVVVTAHPDDVWGHSYDDEHPHNCDAMGCLCEHVIAIVALEADDV